MIAGGWSEDWTLVSQSETSGMSIDTVPQPGQGDGMRLVLVLGRRAG
jgi:hypothetical protein